LMKKNIAVSNKNFRALFVCGVIKTNLEVTKFSGLQSCYSVFGLCYGFTFLKKV
jgi:hypothetical protein